MESKESLLQLMNQTLKDTNMVPVIFEKCCGYKMLRLYPKYHTHGSQLLKDMELFMTNREMYTSLTDHNPVNLNRSLSDIVRDMRPCTFHDTPMAYKFYLKM